jgi:tRNA (mo5U34)-methyltransferase
MRRSKVQHRICNVYQLAPETLGMHDVVFCGSLLLHLHNPLQALINIRSVTRQMAVIETAAIHPDIERQWPDAPLASFGVRHVETEPGENVTYWQFSTAALRDMLVYAGFTRVESQPPFELRPGLPVTASVAFP